MGKKYFIYLGYMKNSQNFNNKETIYEIKGKILNKIHQRK